MEERKKGEKKEAKTYRKNSQHKIKDQGQRLKN